MSTIKKKPTSDVKHVLPTYKKLPIQTPQTLSETDVKQSSKPGNFYIKRVCPSERPVSKGNNIHVSNAGSESLTEFKLTNGNIDIRPAANPKPGLKVSSEKPAFKQRVVVSEEISSTNGEQLHVVGYTITNENTAHTEVTDGWIPGSDLPPCKVCGDKASGLHYGAITCEACKAFFHRTLKRSSSDYQCTCIEVEKKLGSDVTRKTTCPKCRYERCIQLGMSKDAIKIGRYTNTRRRENITAVNMLKGKEDGKIGQTNRQSSERDLKSIPSDSSSGKQVSSMGKPSVDPTPTATDESKISRKRKFDDPEPESGMLFKSLTNSIVQSLLTNQLSSISTRLEHQTIQSEVSPMEQLLMQPYVPNLENDHIPSDIIVRDHQNGVLASQIEGNIAPVEECSLLQMTANQKGDSIHDMMLMETRGIYDQIGNSAIETAIPPIANNLQQSANVPVNNKGIHNTEIFTEKSVGLLESEGADDLHFSIDGLQGNVLMASKFDRMSRIQECKVPCESDGGTFESEQRGGLLPETEGLGLNDCPDEHLDFILDDHLTLFDQYQQPVLSPGYDITVDEMNDIVQQLEQMSGSLNANHVQISHEEIIKRHSEYLEQYKLRNEVFGDMNTLSKEEYFQFYKQTGIDIDNRQEMLIGLLKHVEDGISKLVKFSKSIPGFSDLLLDDQVNLVKASRVEQDLVVSCCTIAMNVITTPGKQMYHVDEFNKVIPKEYVQAKDGYIQKILKFRLSSEEIAVVKAICVTFPDRCELKERAKVEAIHNKLVACMFHLLSFRHEERHLEFFDILEVLIDMRDLSRWNQKLIQEVFEVWPIVNINNHPLVKELVS